MLSIEHRTLYNALRAATDDGVYIPCIGAPSWDNMRVKQQVAQCRSCPLKTLCREAADTNPQQTYGVWGGMAYPRTAKGRPSKKLTEDQ